MVHSASLVSIYLVHSLLYFRILYYVVYCWIFHISLTASTFFNPRLIRSQVTLLLKSSCTPCEAVCVTVAASLAKSMPRYGVNSCIPHPCINISGYKTNILLLIPIDQDGFQESGMSMTPEGASEYAVRPRWLSSDVQIG